MNEFLDRKIDNVLTVCGNADQACPMFPDQVNRYHWGFDAPAHATRTDKEILTEFRRVRDQIQLVFTSYAAGLRIETAHWTSSEPALVFLNTGNEDMPDR